MTTQLGSNADLSSIVIRLNPDPAWGPRTQTFSILGREQSASGFTTIVGSASYSFDPATGNSVTIPVSARVADVRLNFTGNTGAPAGQVAELQVMGEPAPNPDLTLSNVSWTPTSPVETDPITVRATVNNSGTAGSAATDVNFYLADTKVGRAAVGALAAGASTTVSAAIGTRDAGSYSLSAKVDESNTIIEQNDGNNTANAAGQLVVTPVASSDLITAAVNWTPGNPSAGNSVAFSVALRNQGSVTSASGAHGITLTVLNGSSVVTTLMGTYNGSIAAGVTTPAVAVGNWTAVNGRYTVRVVLADDANELPVKRTNNTSERPFFVGRGANMPYDHLEAEDASVGGGATVIGPNRAIGDLAGEASGRRGDAELERRLRRVHHPGQHEHARHPILHPGLSGRRWPELVDQRVRERRVPQGAAADLELRLAVRRRGFAEQLPRVGAGAPHLRRGEHHAGRHLPGGNEDPVAEGSGEQYDVLNRLHRHRSRVGAAESGCRVRDSGRVHPAGRAKRARPGASGQHAAGCLPAGG